ncbi:MAG: hypothetical protein U0452_09645 [Anaerolineae bacterium]
MSTVYFILSVATAVVAAAFALHVFLRWRGVTKRGRKAPYLLAWSFGLLLYGIGAVCQAILVFTWSPFLLGLWYWTGVLMTAAWLGQGTIYLLVRRGNIARNIGMLLILISIMTLPWVLLLTPYTPEGWSQGINLFSNYKSMMQTDSLRMFVGVLNAFGTIALAGGAIYSAVLFRKKQILRNRMIGNWLIAAGALIPATSNTLIKFGLSDLNYVSLLIGIMVIFAGYLLATQAQDEPVRASRRWDAAKPGDPAADSPSTPR